MSEKLLPCPFCGPGQSIVSLWHDDMAQRWRVGCGRCGCSTGTSPRDKTEAPAIAAWNRRTPVAPVSREEIARIIGRAITAYEDNPSPDCKTAKTNACAAAAADTILAALGTKATDTGREG